jgi:hypothetical protein
MAVNRKTLFPALACALLVFSMLGCGSTNHLRSITLDVSSINGVAVTTQAGYFTLQGNGGTMQLQPLGNYSSGDIKDLTTVATYTVIVDPHYNVDAYGNTLPPPCATPCKVAGQGTVEYGPTGLITAVEPADCTWVDIAPVVTIGTAPTPAWFYVGDYMVTATYGGITSQPVYIPVASSAGDQYYPWDDIDPANENNPDGLCGPSS